MPKIIIASGPVIVEDGKVLLNKHGDDGFWKFCGGRVEDFSTSLADNAAREVGEEMGFGIEITSETPFISYARKERNGEMVDIILVHFLARRAGEVKPGEEIKEWDWFELDKLGAMELAPNIIPTLKHFGYLK